MPIGDNITEPIPAVGTAGTSYASQLVAFLTEVKARLEAKVALTSLLAGLFDLSNNGIANAKYLGLYEQLAAPTTPVGSIARYGGELYYVSPSGAVRITLNGNLDAAALNGITGDYAAPAEFQYELGSTTYKAFADSGTSPETWAYMAARAFDVYGLAQETDRVRLSWGGGSSWTLTLPTSPPAATSLLRMDNTGAIATSGNPDHDLTFAANRSVAISGTGKYKHGAKTLRIPINTAGVNTAAGTVSLTAGVAGANMAVSTHAYFPVYGIPAEFDAATVVAEFNSTPGAGVTAALVGDAFQSLGVSGAGSGSTLLTMSGSVSSSTADHPFYLEVTTNGASTCTVLNVLFTYTVA